MKQAKFNLILIGSLRENEAELDRKREAERAKRRKGTELPNVNVCFKAFCMDVALLELEFVGSKLGNVSDRNACGIERERQKPTWPFARRAARMASLNEAPPSEEALPIRRACQKSYPY